MDKMEFMQTAILFVFIIAAIFLVAIVVVRMLVQKIKDKRPAKYRPTSYEQIYAANRQTQGSAGSGTYRMVRGFAVQLNGEKQSKYMPGRNAYEMARTNGKLRSIIFRDNDALQKMLEEKAGSGDFIGANKELVHFGQVIGQYVDIAGRNKKETKVGIIHYSEEGAYIVPARPDAGGVH